MLNSTGNITTKKVSSLERYGEGLIRYALVAVLLWVGMLKFTAYEAEAIKPLVENSPILSWVYGVMSVQTFSMVLGVTEILLGILIAARPFSPKASALGSFGAIIMFLITLTFTFHTRCMATGIWVPMSIANARAVYSERCFIFKCSGMDRRGSIKCLKVD